MLETLRERLLSVQQDFTSGWVVPPGPWGRQGGRGSVVRAEQDAGAGESGWPGAERGSGTEEEEESAEAGPRPSLLQQGRGAGAAVPACRWWAGNRGTGARRGWEGSGRPGLEERNRPLLGERAKIRLGSMDEPECFMRRLTSGSELT